MSFYLVPSASYQTQQKLKKHKDEKLKSKESKVAGHRHKERSHANPGSASRGSVSRESVSSGSSTGTTSLVESSSSSVPNSSESGPSKNIDMNGSGRDPTLNPSGIAQQFRYLETLDSSPGKKPQSDIDSLRSSNTSISSSEIPRRNSKRDNNEKMDLARGRKIDFSRFASVSSIPLSVSDSHKRAKSLFSFSNRKFSQTSLPEFELITDLSVMNTCDGIKEAFYTPSFQVFRFNNFIDILSKQQKEDSINFGDVRLHSMLQFLSRHKSSEFLQAKDQGRDLHYYESILAHELINLRSFLRLLVSLEAPKQPYNRIFNSEELIMANFPNYIRYLMALPNPQDFKLDHLNPIDLTHLRYKQIFKELEDVISASRNEEIGEASSQELRQNTLLQFVTKLSYEFILLETYGIQILTKFNNDHILSRASLRRTFETYAFRRRISSYESTKILVLNSIFSAQFSWSLALSTPFARVLEHNFFSEDHELFADINAYTELERKSEKTSFVSSDQELTQYVFNRSEIKDFDSFTSMTLKDLVDLFRRVESASPKYKSLDRKQFPDPSAVLGHKPANFEYYTKSISTIPSDSIDLIHSRDLHLILSPINYKTFLREFRRILRKGGMMEISVVRLDLYATSRLRKVATKYNKDKHSDIDTAMGIISNFADTISRECVSLFGEGNVKVGTISLTAANGVNSYIEKYIYLKLFEIVGRFDEFSIAIDSEEGTNALDGALNYMQNIRVTKS